MHRFFTDRPADCDPGTQIEIPPQESGHAIKVLRLKEGAQLQIMDGRGWIASARISHPHPKSTRVTLLNSHTSPPLTPRIHLVQSGLKNRSMETSLQLCTQAGIHHAHLVMAEHGEFRGKPGDFKGKMEKWRRVMVESCKQSGNVWLPGLSEPAGFMEVVNRLRGLNGREDALHVAGSLWSSMDRMNAQQLVAELGGRKLSDIYLWIGPEGDFSEGEYRMLAEMGAVGMSLGPHVLRSECAGFAGVTLLRGFLESGM